VNPASVLGTNGVETKTLAEEPDAVHRFISRLADKITGVLSGFDRLVFHGHLRRLCYEAGLEGFLAFRGILRKDFGNFAQHATERVKAESLASAQAQRLPIDYLTSSHIRKETVAKQHLAEHPIASGPICILKTLEPCSIWKLRRCREEQRIRFERRPGKCLHLYHYLIHPDFGFMHVRLQTWMPYQIQVYVNGREWLGRQLDRARLKYTRADNCFPYIADVPRAQNIMNGFLYLPWRSLLDDLARRFNPYLSELLAGYDAKYDWAIHQSEWASDVMFRDPKDLAAIYPALVHHGITDLGSRDVMRFLGRQLVHSYKGEVVTRYKDRPEGICVRHTVRGCSQKIYDKAGSILRPENTINDPSGFTVLRNAQGKGSETKAPRKLRKGLPDLRRRARIHQACNKRYLDAMASVAQSTPLQRLLDSVTRPAELGGRRVRGLRPWAHEDLEMLRAIGRGEFTIHGLRNADLVGILFPGTPGGLADKRRRSAKVSRLLRILRAHDIIRKRPHSYRYDVTSKGRDTIAAVIAASNASVDKLKQCA
jgi:hypothetical protein